jgi:hypothetical protein
MRGTSQQSLLDKVFASLGVDSTPARSVSDRAFAKARSHLHVPALRGLNDDLLARAETAGLLPRWQGLRLVAADASVLMPSIRRCPRTKGLAAAEQRLFALYLPGAEMTLHAEVCAATESERAMLANALEKLGPSDVLLLDRGYPAAWLVNLLNERGIRFVMRCDTSSGGWVSLRRFIQGSELDAHITLTAPEPQDAAAWQCSRLGPTVRVVRQIAPNGQTRVLMTNLTTTQAPAHCFGALYHQRWRIEEAFKRLKHRLNLEAVSGLSQHALLIDVSAKILADNLASLLARAAHESAQAAGPDSPCNLAYAQTVLQSIVPRLLVFAAEIATLVRAALAAIARTIKRRKPQRSAPRKHPPIKPHPKVAYKG